MKSLILRWSLVFNGAILAQLALGCGVPPTPLAAAPLHRATLAGEGGATVQASFQLSGWRLQHVAGAPAMSLADLDAVTLYLIEATPGAPPGGALSAVAGSAYTYVLDAANRSDARVDVIYTNVSANAPGKAYFLAVTATGGGADITNAAAPAAIGARRCYVSQYGGNPAAPGSVRVAPVTYALDAATPIAVGLKLLDARPAILEASVTVTEGSL